MSARGSYVRLGKLGARGLAVMVRNEFRALMANKQIVYNSLLSPVLYFAFYSFGIQSTFGDIAFEGRSVSFVTYSLLGIFAMTLFRQMYQCVYRLIIDKRWGILGLKLLNGVTPPLYILGISTIPLVGTVAQALVLYALACATGAGFGLRELALIVVFMLVCVLFWSSVFTCVALLIRDYKQRDFVMDVLLLPVMFAAPLFYSFDGAPAALRVISALNPLTYQLQAMRELAFQMPLTGQVWAVLLLAAFAFAAACFCLDRADLRSDEH